MSFKVADSQINPLPTREPYVVQDDGFMELKMENEDEKPDKDPWKARSKGMVCATCVFYVVKKASNPELPEIGRCRKCAPTMKGFPAVFPNDWCGEHRIDEEKL